MAPSPTRGEHRLLKDLNRGDFLIDDRPNNGADLFAGTFVQFGKEPFTDWPAVMEYLRVASKAWTPRHLQQLSREVARLSRYHGGHADGRDQAASYRREAKKS